MVLEIGFTINRNGTEGINISGPTNPIPSVGCLQTDVPRSEKIKSALGNRYCSEANGLAQGKIWLQISVYWTLVVGPFHLEFAFASSHYRIAGVVYTSSQLPTGPD